MKKQNKKLIVEEQFTTKGRAQNATCTCKIFELNNTSHYHVVLSGSDAENYTGRSVSNHFEHFATAIKKNFLTNVHPKNIKWFEHMNWKDQSLDDLLLSVSMKFSKKEYCNPSWGASIDA